MSQGNDVETRFLHLLQPIRDLTKNWEVDIAKQLEDYLTEIEDIRITFDAGSTSMNFAEAALLIQGSACIYSKKVEYLYALVYQTLDLLASKKKQQQPSSLDEDGTDKDTSFAYQKNAEEFLSLDDIQMSKNIDLKEADLNDNFVKIVPRTPLALLKMDRPEEGMHLKDSKGEVLGKIVDFRLLTSVVHTSGALLLDMSHLSHLEASMARLPMSTPLPLQPQTDNDNVFDWPAGNGDNMVPPNQDASQSLDDIDMADVPEDSFTEEQQQQPPEANKMEARRNLRPREVQSKPQLARADPWIPQDPHQAKTLPEKPFRKGKPFKIPKSLAVAAGNKRKRDGKAVVQLLPPISQFINQAYYSQAAKLPNSALKRPLYAEFGNLYYDELKRRQASRRETKERLVSEGKLEDLAAIEADELNHHDDDDDDDGGAMLGGGEDFGGAEPEEDGDLDVDNDRVGDQPDFETSSTQEIAMSYEDLVRRHVEEYMASAQQYTQMTELATRVQSWEERITPILRREERYGYFDIHEYGSIIITRLEQVKAAEPSSRPAPFSQLVRDRTAHDISRLFLATLQLANTYNVGIDSQGVEEAIMDSMTLRLLNTKRHNEELQDYRAPSLDK